WWNYESLGEGKYLWKGPKGTVLLRTNTGVYDVTDEHVSTGPRTPDQLSAPTTVEDVTTEATGSSDVSARVSSAEKTVHKIIAHLPQADAFDDRYPAPPDEQPFVPPRQRREKTWRELAPQYDLLEGYSHPAAEPEPSVLEKLLA